MSEQSKRPMVNVGTKWHCDHGINPMKAAFESWYDNDDITEPLPDDYTILGKRYLYMGWQAATAEANKRIDALEGEVAESDFVIKQTTTLLAEICLILKGEPPAKTLYGYHDLPKMVRELQASNNQLREALEKAMNDEAGWYEIAKQALSAAQAESLQAHDAETIKRYADDLDNNHWVFIPHDLRKPLKEGK